MYDAIIVGGGPSGLMASIAAASHGAHALLIDKGDRLGRKLGISGGGRCNVTNNKEPNELIRHIPGNGRFLYSALSSFGSREIAVFFEELGIRLKEEDRGRMFPVSDKAATVVEALIRKVKESGVDIRVNAPVERVLYSDGAVRGVLLRNGRDIRGRTVILAAGGKSVPETGSTGDAYAWAEEAGHPITPLYPTEVPITSSDPFIRSRALQGLSLRSITLSVWNARGKKIVEHEGDVLFTHFGLSGPAALRCSQFVVKERAKAGGTVTVLLTIDLFPSHREDDLFGEIAGLAGQEARKTVKNALKERLPERLIPALLALAEIREDTVCANTPKSALRTIAALLKRFPVHANGTLPLEKAFVTGGGVDLKHVDPRTMQSKLMRGLFFCGEILDVHGYTGGYNITAAFSTGYTAGKHAAETALSPDDVTGFRSPQ